MKRDIRDWPQRLAIFDLDYTLTKKGTWGRFVVRAMKGRTWRWPELALRAGMSQGLYKLGVLPRIAVKTQMMRVCLTGRPREEVEAMAREFARQEVETGLRAGAVPAIEAHRAAGDHLMIASAAVDAIVGPMAELLGIEDWVATAFAWDATGRLADHFGSPNCYGTQKLDAVTAFYRGLKPCDTFITMYSDSSSDVDLFTFADNIVVINPSAKLRALAKQRGWPIKDWDTPHA